MHSSFFLLVYVGVFPVGISHLAVLTSLHPHLRARCSEGCCGLLLICWAERGGFKYCGLSSWTLATGRGWAQWQRRGSGQRNTEGKAASVCVCVGEEAVANVLLYNNIFLYSWQTLSNHQIWVWFIVDLQQTPLTKDLEGAGTNTRKWCFDDAGLSCTTQTVRGNELEGSQKLQVIISTWFSTVEERPESRLRLNCRAAPPTGCWLDFERQTFPKSCHCIQSREKCFLVICDDKDSQSSAD